MPGRACYPPMARQGFAQLAARGDIPHGGEATYRTAMCSTAPWVGQVASMSTQMPRPINTGHLRASFSQAKVAPKPVPPQPPVQVVQQPSVIMFQAVPVPTMLQRLWAWLARRPAPPPPPAPGDLVALDAMGRAVPAWATGRLAPPVGLCVKSDPVNGTVTVEMGP